jgi:hypothetical protein
MNRVPGKGGNVLLMTLEHLELLERSDVKHSDGSVSRAGRNKVAVWVPGAGEDRVLVKVRGERLTGSRIPEGDFVVCRAGNNETLGWVPVDAADVLAVTWGQRRG